jgi:hypothetical protein
VREEVTVKGNPCNVTMYITLYVAVMERLTAMTALLLYLESMCLIGENVIKLTNKEGE